MQQVLNWAIDNKSLDEALVQPIMRMVVRLKNKLGEAQLQEAHHEVIRRIHDATTARVLQQLAESLFTAQDAYPYRDTIITMAPSQQFRLELKFVSNVQPPPVVPQPEPEIKRETSEMPLRLIPGPPPRTEAHDDSGMGMEEVDVEGVPEQDESSVDDEEEEGSTEGGSDDAKGSDDDSDDETDDEQYWHSVFAETSGRGDVSDASTQAQDGTQPQGGKVLHYKQVDSDRTLMFVLRVSKTRAPGGEISGRCKSQSHSGTPSGHRHRGVLWKPWNGHLPESNERGAEGWQGDHHP